MSLPSHGSQIEDKRARRRKLFDEVADLYARVRPGYPDGTFDEIWSQAGLDVDAKILEIGCGTGQATIPLLRRGATVVALEIGPHLADLARVAVAPYGGRSRIITSDFDRWDVPACAFDLVLAATSFHWLDPQTRCIRVARALRDRGWLAVLANVHVSDESGDRFFRRSQDAYAEAFEADGRSSGLPMASSLSPAAVDEQLFGRREHRMYRWTQAFDAKSYVETLATYSENRDIPEPARERLFDQLAAIIRNEFSNAIEKHWVTSLTLARRR